jgi:acyl carrier protein
MSPVEIHSQLRQFLSEAAQAKGVADFSDDQSLFQAGVIDSLGVFRLISFLEETFPITIDDQDMVPENFQSVTNISNFVLGKMGVKPGAEAVTQPAA